MKLVTHCGLATAIALIAPGAMAQSGAQEEAEAAFQAGLPLGVSDDAGGRTELSDNVTVYGSFNAAESCVFDPDRNLILAVSGGAPQDMTENDAYVSLLNSDGTVHTAKWIGATRDGLTLNQTLGSAIADGTLYVNDIDTVRMFELETGEPMGSVPVPEAGLLNGIAVTDDGTVYTSNSFDPQRIYEISPEGEVSTLVEGEPLAVPNGVAIDQEGNIVIVNIRSDEILTFSPEGELLETETSADSGNDGLVILDDGTKYVSSVVQGTLARIGPDGGEAEVIASGIPNAASICYDSTQNQIVVPMTSINAFGFVPLD